MNLAQMNNTQLALILEGLRAIYVEDHEAERDAMIQKIEDKLSERGLRLKAA